MNGRRTMVLAAAMAAGLAATRPAIPAQDDRETLDTTRARMYRHSSSAVWTAAAQAVKTMSLAFPRASDSSQFMIAWSAMPMTAPRERRSELRVFVSPFAEPARVYVGSVMRTPDPEDPRRQIVTYNGGELESSFFAALERVLGETGEAIPVSAARRAAAAHRLLGAAGDANPCLKRLEDDEPLGMNADGTVPAPEKIRDSDVVPVSPGAKPRDKAAQPRIDATITEDGATIGVRLIQGSRVDRPVEAAVLGAASLWHYKPVTIDGCTVPVRLTLAVEFSSK